MKYYTWNSQFVESVYFKDVPVNTFFRFTGSEALPKVVVFLKVVFPEDIPGSISLETGYTVRFSDFTKVIPVKLINGIEFVDSNKVIE